MLTLSGVNQALAPQISAAFYSGDREHVQRITRLATAGSLASALVILAVFSFAGTFILSIFDQSYATPQMHVVLMLFALGATTVTACGPIELLLQLTGLQHALLKVLVVVNVLGLVLTALTTDLFGPVGAAAALAATVVTWNLIAVWIARREIGINPTIVGLAADLRGQRLRPAWRRAMKIVQVQTQAEAAGAQRVSDMVGEGLRARGHQVRTVFMYRKTDVYDRDPNADFVLCRRPRGPGRPDAGGGRADRLCPPRTPGCRDLLPALRQHLRHARRPSRRRRQYRRQPERRAAQARADGPAVADRQDHGDARRLSGSTSSIPAGPKRSSPAIRPPIAGV